ncbi:MAG: metallophosphoesterase family protein [Candidatus Aenigmarchaeota archaeon]|nr:metallophosphoesterase family protein [Candidatus Aenigmarchaeota archaeon]
MRLMIISGIYSNFPALQSVFQHLNKNFGAVNYILCAGDVVGIGPYPNEVCNFLRGIEHVVSVKGDFDQAVVDGNLRGIDPLLAETMKWTREVISKDNMDFLCDLDGYRSLKLGRFNVLLLHGSPADYLNGEITKMESLENIQKHFEDTGADIIVCGQGHLPFVKEHNNKFIINPGSVGQPKDDISKASYVFVDTDTMEISFQRVKYRVNLVLDKMKEEKFSETIINNFYLV